MWLYASTTSNSKTYTIHHWTRDKQVLHTIIVIFKLTTISVFRAKMLQNPQIQIIQSYTYLDHSWSIIANERLDILSTVRHYNLNFWNTINTRFFSCEIKLSKPERCWGYSFKNRCETWYRAKKPLGSSIALKNLQHFTRGHRAVPNEEHRRSAESV